MTDKVNTISTNSINEYDVNIENKLRQNINAIEEKHFHELAEIFCGIECRIDSTLKGEKYYIMLSPELFGRLKNHKVVEESSK